MLGPLNDTDRPGPGAVIVVMALGWAFTLCCAVGLVLKLLGVI